MHALRDEIALAQCQPASNSRPRTRRPHRVKCVNIKRQMDRRIAADPAERHIHHPADAVAVNIVHAECLDAVLAQDRLLAAINVPEADVHDLLDADALVVLDPTEGRVWLVFGQPSEEGDRHTMDVAAVARLGRIDVSVRVNPDDGDFATQPLTHGFCSAGNGADGDGMIAAECEDEAPLSCVLVDLAAQLLCDGADCSWLLHAPVVGVFLRHQVSVRVHLAVEVDVVLKVVCELGFEA